MPRKIREERPLVYVFSEGESEQAYVDFLKEHFEENVRIMRPKGIGIFDEAWDKFRKDKKYKDALEVIDEIWFSYDVEKEDVPKWEHRLDIIKHLRRLRKNPNIQVRLLMTTACVEYWLLLHYQYAKPSMVTPADKDRMFDRVKSLVQDYEKGDPVSTKKIAGNYMTAILNGEKVLNSLRSDGIPTLEDTDERNAWLSKCGMTFTTVHEAVKWLEERRKR